MVLSLQGLVSTTPSGWIFNHMMVFLLDIFLSWPCILDYPQLHILMYTINMCIYYQIHWVLQSPISSKSQEL